VRGLDRIKWILVLNLGREHHEEGLEIAVDQRPLLCRCLRAGRARSGSRGDVHRRLLSQSEVKSAAGAGRRATVRGAGRVGDAVLRKVLRHLIGSLLRLTVSRRCTVLAEAEVQIRETEVPEIL